MGGAPRDWDHARERIRGAFADGRDGARVEVGCIAAHGRTGTVLACMAILAGVPPDEAIEWVRDHYCSKAVETGPQEHWIEWFAESVEVQGGSPRERSERSSADPLPRRATGEAGGPTSVRQQ